MKVLYVIDAFENPHAGTEGQLYQLVTELVRAGHEPHLLVFRESEFLSEGRFPCAHSVLGVSASIRSPGTWRRLLAEARRFHAQGFRLAHVFFNDASVLCPPVFRLAGIRSIISRRDMGYWYTPFYLWTLRFTRHFVRCVITNSEAVKAVTVQKEWYKESQVRVVYNGYPMTNEGMANTSPEPENWPVQETALTVCLVANIRPIKRIQDAIEALAMMPAADKPLHLVVIGGGQPDTLANLSEELGVSRRVHFLGSRQDVRECLALADIGLLSSESEGFSNAIVEYMLAGLPVVCTDTGGNPEAVMDCESGFLYPVGNVAELSRKLGMLAADEKLRLRLGEQAKLQARQRYCVEAMTAAHTEIYKSLMEERNQ